VSHPSTTEFLVLHGVRLKGFAEPGALASLWELDENDVTAELKTLADAGLVHHREGRVSGWSLTPDGRAAHARMAGDEIDGADARPAVKDAYERFLDINPDLLGACTSWQLRTVGGSQVVNEHQDPAYDASVVEQLAEVHERVGPVLDVLAGALARFGRYPVRLENALRQVRAGATEYFTKPLIDSYHTVWFELHEDLLSTLGLQRAAEGRA
jgi:DNA-binding MarR family transcriptional regulator